MKSQVLEKQTESENIEDVYENTLVKMVEVFEKDTLFIHDCIKQTIQNWGLDKDNKRLRIAMMKLAIGVKNNQYPK